MNVTGFLGGILLFFFKNYFTLHPFASLQKQKSQSREPLETAESAVKQKNICFLTGRLETAPPPSDFVPDVVQTKVNKQHSLQVLE